jgi:putative ABC transport system permease protein
MKKKKRTIAVYLWLANRNLWRKKSRLVLLGLSFFLLSTITVLLLSYSNGITKNMLQSTINNFTGHFAVYSDSSVCDALSYEKSMPFAVDDSLISAIQRISGGVVHPQYRRWAFLYTQRKQQVGILQGVASSFSSRFAIIDGECLDNSGSMDRQILLSASMAQNLDIKLGDPIAVEVVNEQGVRNFDYFFLKGIYSVPGVPSIMISHIAMISLADMQNLAIDTALSVTELLVTDIKNKSMPKLFAQNLVVQKYSTYGNILIGMMMSIGGIAWIVGLTAILVIVIFFFDTIVAAMIERKSEFGTMMSMGISNFQIIFSVLAEYLIFSLMFVAPGVLFGGSIAYILSIIGIPLYPAIRDFMGGINEFTPVVNWMILGVTFLVITGFIFIATYFGINRIVRMDPIKALRND